MICALITAREIHRANAVSCGGLCNKPESIDLGNDCSTQRKNLFNLLIEIVERNYPKIAPV